MVMSTMLAAMTYSALRAAMWRIIRRVGELSCAAVLVGMATAREDDMATRFPDEVFFRRHLDVARDDLEGVRRAVLTGDFEAARAALLDYYRTRSAQSRFGPPGTLELTAAERDQFADWGRRMLDHEIYDEYWTGPYTINWWHDPKAERFARMYWWDALAKAYIARDRDPDMARLWVGLVRSFVAQCPPPEGKRGDIYWEGLTGGIRLRGGWPVTFHVFAHSEVVTGDDLVVFLKSLIEQAEFIREHHWPVGNKITFAMVGLYSAGTAFPELCLAPAWRDYAASTALANLERGFFPDGMGMELSPGYHSTFRNYLTMVDIARQTGRAEDTLMRDLAAGCERLFLVYPKLTAPDRQLPRYQDGGAPNVKERLSEALEYYPDNRLFQWFASDGERGQAPDFCSVVLPYAGYIAMRTGWERDATYVGFDVGPIGWGHAHQDKLNLVLWAYGRGILMDTAHGNYRAGEFSQWAMDTFSHNTALVDNRPQRRRWGKSGGFVPDTPLTDYTFETHPAWDRASGVYDGAYGLPGPSDAYPYSEGSTFYEGWGRPARHHRRVFFFKPDIIVVADTLVSTDGEPHDYELRWHLDSTAVDEAGEDILATHDEGRANLVVAPLDREGLTVTHTSAAADPILGWNFHGSEPTPATTIQHRKAHLETATFLTLLLAVRPGDLLLPADIQRGAGDIWRATLSDGRCLEVAVPRDPTRALAAVVSD